jgi:hypothetical protein
MGYPIDPYPDHSPNFSRALQIAGETLQEQFNSEGGKFADDLDYRWLKPDQTWPSFEHFIFGFRNQIFAVLVATTADGQISLSNKEIDRCLEPCASNNLVPCLFLVDELTMRPCRDGWNLVHLLTRKPINPENIATEEQVEMSEWELRNYSIQVVKNHIKNQGMNVVSSQDILQIDPQIWFVDKDGARAWVIVRHYPMTNGDEKLQWVGFERSNPELLSFDGYHAAVSIASSAPALRRKDGELIPLSQRFTGDAPRYRGDTFYVKFEGLQRIFVC